jgi:hypothetical protein
LNLQTNLLQVQYIQYLRISTRAGRAFFALRQASGRTLPRLLFRALKFRAFALRALTLLVFRAHIFAQFPSLLVRTYIHTVYTYL